MSESDPHDLALEAIERLEVRALTWGIVDGGITKEEALDAIATSLHTADAHRDPEDILEDLIDQTLLTEAIGAAGGLYIRSRFGEFLRLLVHLRQLFRNKPWRTAPTLVSDYRVDVRRRRYPKRDQMLEAAIDAIATESPLQPEQCRTFQALTAGTNGLARFQVQATARILGAIGRPDGGTIVTAGTGSGKTLAFYLPALMALVSRARLNLHQVDTLAIYPRRELLKDQLTEAVRMVRILNKADVGCRPLRVGAFYGDVPHDASDAALEGQAGWRLTRDRRGRVCPLLRCPACDGELAWLDLDRQAAKERLCCTGRSCGATVDDALLSFTRRSVIGRSPDVLFTTTEMLNQRLADSTCRALFGVGRSPRQRPRLVLLDEVHTYAGTFGAQAGLVLRRWRHALGSPVHVVGLSATLTDATNFFASLIGVRSSSVLEITPADEDLEEASADYQVALRGDPASATSLLSTSIQTAMLLARTLDPPTNAKSQGRFGRCMFAFTDDLDVTNRLFDNLRDAEAYDAFGRVDPKREPLAALRRGGFSDDGARRADGQIWQLCATIGWDLGERLRIARTTSRDPGVLSNADVIVATAALEVGFNDPNVGAILQHKAPREPASFVQRRGRAGRRPNMRPITVTVLSDYGRDRLTFQEFEHLFSPIVPARSLPLRNVYVLRMQATMALLDWLMATAPADAGGWAWTLLASPLRPEASPRQSRFIEHAERTLDDLLHGSNERRSEIASWLRGALSLDTPEVDALLWSAPRALLLEVVPTLLRRLRYWRRLPAGSAPERDRAVPSHPLPEFMPRALFADVDLPEVEIRIPRSATWRDDPPPEWLPVRQALQLFTPGRVSRRFAEAHGRVNHWLPLAYGEPQLDLPIADFVQAHESVGRPPGETIEVRRPWRFDLQQLDDPAVRPESNAVFSWRTAFGREGAPLAIDPPHRGPWSGLLTGMEARLHRFGAGLSVWRYAAALEARIRLREGDERVVHANLVDETGAPAAVGFAFETDGLIVRFSMPTATTLASRALPEQLSATMRSAFFRSVVLEDDELPASISVFARDWLQQIVLATVLCHAVREGLNLADTIAWFERSTDLEPYRTTMRAIFGFAVSEDDAIDAEEADGEERETNLARRLRAHLEDGLIRRRILGQLRTTSSPAPEVWGTWLQRVLCATLAEAVLDALIEIAPRETTVDTLVVDTQPVEERVDVIVSEQTVGGGGVIEAAVLAIAQEPGRFLDALEAALAPRDLEAAANDLGRLVHLSLTMPAVGAALSEVGASDGSTSRLAALNQLRRHLAPHGIAMTQALAVAIQARLVRPGLSNGANALLADLLARWDELERRYGLALGLREFATIVAEDTSRADAIANLLGLAHAEPRAIAAAAGSLLWPRPHERRMRTLRSWNPYRRPASVTDPALVRIFFLMDGARVVNIEHHDWWEEAARCLALDGAVRLRGRAGEEPNLRAAIITAALRPIEVGHMRFFPVLRRVSAEGNEVEARMILRELS